MLSIVFGNAFEVSSASDGDRIRVYRANGRTFVGHETDDIVHVCDTACAQTVLAETGDQWTETDDGGGYVVLEAQKDSSGAETGNFATADVMSFDPGDDPYILCGACHTELHRDEDRYLEMFGNDIDGDDEDVADRIPADWPVQPIHEDDDVPAANVATCGTCHLSWDDTISTSMTPAPSARCPFEQFHN